MMNYFFGTMRPLTLCAFLIAVFAAAACTSSEPNADSESSATQAAAAATPSPTPAPSQTPTATPTPSPTPTPTPRPASYRIAYDGLRFIDAGGGLVQTEFSLSLTNTGEVDGVDIPVRVEGGGGTFDDAPIARLGAGGSTSVTVVHALPPGDHQVLFRIGADELWETVSILAPDLVVTPGVYAIAGDGRITIDARITNTGSAAAENVVVSAAWVPQPDAEGSSGSKSNAASIPSIAPGATHDATLSMHVFTGAYNLTLTAATSSLEAVTGNNASSATVEIEYKPLVVEVASAEVTGYETDGNGVVELRVRVTNAGVAPTGPLTVGAECAPDAQAPCEAETTIDSVAPAGNPETVLSLMLQQGETALTVYAGANDDGYRWGERNVVAHTAIVPVKQPVEMALAAPMEVAGYWSDGTANIDIAITLRNDGYQPVTDTFAVTVTCYGDDTEDAAPVADCGGATGVALADGFGPASATAMFRAPIGTTLRASLPGGAQETAGLTVPERILGVEREVWECFRDVPDEAPSRDNDFFGGCGGWGSETIRKWDPGLPVRVWADPTGEQHYIDILRESLDELARLLNLDFVWVERESEANLKAYVGVPSSRSASIFPNAGYCAEAAGCGGPDTKYGDAITSGSLSVWLDSDHDRMEIKHVTIHEILHAVTGVRHAPSPLSMMSKGGALRLERLTDFDLGQFELHAHPLVQPGMTMNQVEAHIVFSDELLDPPSSDRELDGLDLAELAFASLAEAGSASFIVQGGWRPTGCRRFSGSLSVGDLSSGNVRLLHYDGNEWNFLLAYDGTAWRYWRERGGEWVSTTRSAFWDATPWRIGFSDPTDMLVSVLRYAVAADIAVTEAGAGSLRLDVTLDNALVLPLNWAQGATIEVSVTLDAETYEMSGYSMDWRFHGASECNQFDVTATRGEYGVDVPDPR